MTLKTIDDILSGYRERQRDALLPVLWEVQTEFGMINSTAVTAISHALRVPAVEIYGVIEFYSLFSDHPTGERTIHICTDPTCGIAGSDRVMEELCAELGIAPDDTTPDGKITVKPTTCLGLCEHAPAALISQRTEGEYTHAPVTDAVALLNQERKAHSGIFDGIGRVFFGAVSGDRRQSLAEYGDYAALRLTLQSMTPAQVSGEVEAAGLVGRGGAGFPTGMKWRFTRDAPGQPHYLICNADESEPGTFKDRVVMEHQPHLLLEGMTLAAYAIGAQRCYLFVRGEYPEAAASLQAAISEAEQAGMLGENLFGTDFSCQIEIRRGGGAYICGEETALFEAIEGKRGYPRIKPPFPTTHGLFGKPTTINNVETLCAVPAIMIHGAAWYRETGTQKSTGTKLVSVSGHVHKPGVYEIPFGMTLRTLLDGYCGGVEGDLQAVLMGGAAGTFLRPEQIDVPLTIEDLQAIGSTLGSGAIMVFNDTIDLRDILQRLARFFAHESCGKCFPCQLGTQRQREIIDRMATPLPDDRVRLLDIGVTMREASLCGLGQTAASAIMSAIEQWPELF